MISELKAHYPKWWSENQRTWGIRSAGLRLGLASWLWTHSFPSACSNLSWLRLFSASIRGFFHLDIRSKYTTAYTERALDDKHVCCLRSSIQRSVQAKLSHEFAKQKSYFYSNWNACKNGFHYLYQDKNVFSSYSQRVYYPWTFNGF